MYIFLWVSCLPNNTILIEYKYLEKAKSYFCSFLMLSCGTLSIMEINILKSISAF